MSFNYRKLKGRIIEVCGSQAEFASCMQLSEHTISQKINNKRPWSQKDICKAMEILDLTPEDIQEYFFSR